MASNKMLKVSAQQTIIIDCERELSVINMSDDQIKKQIIVTHTHTDQDFDVASLFAVVKNILNPAIIAVINIVMGTKQAYVGNLLGESGPEPDASFIPPLCMLKELSNKMACKNLGEKTAHKTAMSILNKLKDYSWDAKAVLTLAAFALDYGEFWHLAESHSLNQLTKSLGILKRVPIVLLRPGIEKNKYKIVQLNNLIRATLDVIDCIFNLEERLAKHDLKDIPTLSTATDSISVEVFWAIVAVADCMACMCYLIKDDDNTQELLPFTGKITSILKSLRDQIDLCDRTIAERESYLKLKRFLQSPPDIVEVLKKLIFAEDSTYSRELRHNWQQDTFYTNTLFSDMVEEVRTKNVLLFFSDLDISKEDVSILKLIYEEISKSDQYKILWIPVVKQWVDEMQTKFETVVGDCEMEWYVVRHFSSVLGIKYVEEEWQFKKKPIVVVLNSQGIVEHKDAFHMIKTWGINAFPFTVEKERELCSSEDWFVSSVINFIDDIQTWINDGKYTFFYGGTDESWITQFREKAEKMKNDSVKTSGAGISIKLFGVGKDGKGKDDLDIFWKNINNLFFSKSQKDTELDKKMKEIQKLLSYKNEKGWVVLCKGPRLVFSGYETTVVTVLEKFDEWKQELHNSTTAEFEVILEENYKLNKKTDFHCCDFTIKTNAGWVPGSLKCPDPDCSKIMEMYVNFKCCHEGHTANAVP